MSSSAFTPTQIEVTNNVPVNVPVVQVFRQYSAIAGTDITATTTNPTFGVVTLNNVNIFRSGEEARFYFTFSQSSGGSAGSGTYRFRMPSGITIDTSKTGTNTSSDFFGKSVVGRAYASLPSGSELDTQLFVVNSTTIECRSFGSHTVANFGGALRCTFEFNVPIAEWAGSGTTTLATRAVEEYAWNSSTTDADDTTSFGYGPNGVNFGSFTTARNKRVRFQTPIQSTDILSLEFKRDGQWIPIESCTSQGCSPLFFQGTTSYGMSIEQIPGNNTDVTIKFGTYRNTSNTTYAGVGNAWSFLAGGNAQWRVRKVSGGAQVGYPVSARNIVGDTSGTAVPTGMLGEVRTVTGSGTLQVNPSTYGDIAGMSLQLGPGTWMLTLKAAAYIKHNAVGNKINTVNLILTDSSNAVIANSPVQAQVENQPQTSGTAMQFVWNLTSTTVWTNTTTQSIKMRGLRSNLTGGIELLNDSDARITAIIATRIA